MADHQIQAVIVEHAGKSYIQMVQTGNYWYGGNLKNVAANGVTDLPPAPGDNGFMVYDGAPVRTLQRITPPKRITTKYVLREDLRGASKAEVIGVSDYGNLPEGDQALYTGVVEDIPQQAEDIPFVIQKENGPPSPLPQGVVTADKNYFARFKSFHHLGPVQATPRYVLARISARISEIVKNNPHVEWSMLRYTPEQILKDSGYTTLSVSLRPLTINGINATATNLKTWWTIDTGHLLSYQTRVPAITGENLEDLEAKVAAHVSETTKNIASWYPPDHCPCCQKPLKEPEKLRPKRKPARTKAA